MTRKDFNAIAAAFKQARYDIRASDVLTTLERGDAEIGLEVAMDRVMAVLAASNPNFDRQRFITVTLVP